MRKVLFLWMMLTFLTSLHVWADGGVSFTASAPETVAVGDQFRLTYKITTQKVRGFRAPSIKGFEVLMGPSSSQQSSVQIINGKTTSTSSITYTYILLATAEGSFTLPGATITADGEQKVSNSVSIKVLPADKTDGNSGAANGSNKRGSTGRTSTGTQISANELFILSTLSKTSVYEQEALLLTYKIYSQVNLRGFDNVKLPDFKGFHSQEIELGERRWGLEHYKGRNYQTTVYRQFVLFPQQSGKIAIEPARFDASIAQEVAVSDPFDAFFNGGANYVEIKKSLFTPRTTIDVKPLPAGKPANFSGGVGEFELTSALSNAEVKTNDAVTLKLSLKGTGNLKLMSTPEVKFPEDFEVYDPKVENNVKLTTSGLTGSKEIEYLAIPRTAGTYKIPAISYSYFDTKQGKYRTLTTPAYELKVAKGKGNAAQTIANFSNKEELKVLNEDIRYIKQGQVDVSPRDIFFFGSLNYWLCYLIPTLLFVAFFVYYRKQINLNSNAALLKNKKANKVASKRMKQAGRLLANNERDAFYDEVLRALWGYVSDKLSIPVSRLSKDNIEGELTKVGIDSELIDQFIRALNDCEFARFAPGDANQAMDAVYHASVDVISRIEGGYQALINNYRE